MVLSVAGLKDTISVTGLTPLPYLNQYLIRFLSFNSFTCSHGTGHNPGYAAYMQDLVTPTSPVVYPSAWCCGSLPELNIFTGKDEGDGMVLSKVSAKCEGGHNSRSKTMKKL